MASCFAWFFIPRVHPSSEIPMHPDHYWIGATLVLIVVVGHGVCCQIFGIWYNMFHCYPFWKLIFGLLWWVPTGAISLWPAVFLDMDLFTTLVKSYILPGIWLSSRTTNISTAAALEINLIQSLVDWIFNGQSVCLWKWRLVLRLFFDCSRFPPVWIHKISVFSRSLLYKGLICFDILLWYDIHVTHTKFLDKLCNLLVFLNIPQT